MSDPAPCPDRLFVPSPSSYPTDSLDDHNARERGNLRWTRYIEGEMTDASLPDEAIEATQHALDSDLDSKNHARLLVVLGLRLVTRYIVDTNVIDLSRAISMFERVLELSCDQDSDLADLLDQLGVCLWSLFDREGELLGLHCSVLLGRCAVVFTPFEHAYKPIHLHNLGISFARRFERTGEVEDIEQAVAVHRRALELTPDGHADKPGRLNSLGNSFSLRFKRTGELNDIEQAIAAHCRALELTPDDHVAKPAMFNSLGNSFFRRFERTGELDDIEQAIAAHRRALELTPDGHADKPAQNNNLGISFSSRFERTGELDDIEQAIAAHRRALELTPDNHADKPGRLNNLGISFFSRFERTGELDDIEQAVAAHRRALELTPDGHASKPMLYSNIGTSFRLRFERTGELDDIEQAIAAHRRALELTPDGHADKHGRFSNLGTSFSSRFERTGGLDDTEQAIAAHRRALELTPDGHAGRYGRFSNLGTSFFRRFERTGDLDDIEQAIATHRRALELLPDGHAERLVLFDNLSASLRALFSHQPSKPTFNEIIEVSTACIMCPLGNPARRLRAALRCADLHAEHPTFTTTEAWLSAHSHIISVLPEVVWVGHDIHRRFDESRELGKFVNAAVSAAVVSGSLGSAVEWLEAGRALIWSQVLSLRTPLDDLREYDLDLADELQQIQQELQQTAPTSFALEATAFGDVPGMTVNSNADRHRRLAIQYGSLLRQIRGHSGFEDFLLPRKLNSLVPPPEHRDGPVVYLHVDSTRCHALVIQPDGTITSIPLPDLTLERASQLGVLWTDLLKNYPVRKNELSALGVIEGTHGQQLKLRVPRHSSRVQEEDLVDYLPQHMWEWIVWPVLEGLQLLNTTSSELNRPPHITWCPTGPLTQLPLHAAGIYSDPDGPRAFDIIVSSYTPTLSALQRSSQEAAKQTRVPTMLIVTQPATPGQAPLPKTAVEGACIAELLHDSHIACTLFNDTQTTVDAVRNIIHHYPWLHLACHGLQHRGHATQSAFALYDGPLSLADLMRTVADDAELAFLSACQTATGDSGNPEESVHLAAGMLAVGFKGVIATMWSIWDEDAPIVVEAYYKKLIELRKSGAVMKGSTGAAYALHEAVAKLRAEVGENNFGRWAPFVHFGV